jgi:hypothetical protein
MRRRRGKEILGDVLGGVEVVPGVVTAVVGATVVGVVVTVACGADDDMMVRRRV